MTTTYAEFETIYIMPDGTGRATPGTDQALATVAAEVRQAMYQSPGGTWFGARFHYLETGGMTADFSYDDEPEWTNKPDPSVYVQDLAIYPRDPIAIPQWLNAYINP